MMRRDRFTEGAQEVLAALTRHPERSEGSGGDGATLLQILRSAQNDRREGLRMTGSVRSE